MILYIHIPFCNSKCYYCSFGSFSDKFALKTSYLKALLLQFDFELDRFCIKKNSIESVYIGGGTPSTMNIEFYYILFSKIKRYLKPNIEITIEANPNLSHKNWLKEIRKLGINRISFGVQSFDCKKLKKLGRNHNKQDAINSIRLAKESGFDNISIDLIYDFYMDNKTLIKYDLDIAFSLPINHISTYSLTIEQNTKFEGKHSLKTKGDGFSKYIFDNIKNRGFMQYEVSNFGTYQSYHNLSYWNYKDYIGIGFSAVGFLKNKRFYSADTLSQYIKTPHNSKVENLTFKDIKIEKFLLGFRSIVGVDIDILNKQEQTRADILLKNSKIYKKNNRYYNNNFLLADELVNYILL